jgi:hypothetical protein
MWKNRRWAGVTRTSPWLFEGGPENSLARGHDDVLIDPTLELDFGTEEQNEDDEPEGFDRADVVLDGSVAHIEPSEEPHRPSSVRAIVDLSDDVVVSPHAPNDGEAEAETEPTAQPARQSAEKRAAKSGKQQSRTRVALDTF